ncbi:MAG: hypothetical protein Q8L47_05340 [bacterium]|nr:hypothetical protein [bacterium]
MVVGQGVDEDRVKNTNRASEFLPNDKEKLVLDRMNKALILADQSIVECFGYPPTDPAYKNYDGYYEAARTLSVTWVAVKIYDDLK